MRNNHTVRTIEQAFEEFIKYGTIKNLSNHTLSYYQRTFDKFINFIGEDKPTNIITSDLMGDYILYLKADDNINDITINTHIRGMRAILYYFMRLGYMDKFKIQLIKAEKPIKETYTDSELEILLKKPNLRKCRFTEYRDYVVINYLLATGNRISTVANIKIGDLDFENGLITLTKTKNKRQHIIPMASSLKTVLIEYLQYRGGGLDDYLFPDQWGQQIKVDGLKQAVKRYNRSRGVMRTSCHAFRHTFAKKWILNGGGVLELQHILDHATLEQTREYVNLFATDVQKSFNIYNALDNFIGNKAPITMKRGW